MKVGPISLSHYFPVCLLFKPERIQNVKRIFPFDSGAFEDGLYGAYLHHKMNLGDFGLEPNISTPGKLITVFFGSTAMYLSGKMGVTSKFDPTEFEATSYAAMVAAKDSNSTDNRGSGIEVQISDALSIKENVDAVILPSTFADGSTGTKLRAIGVEIIPYRTYERSRPGEYTSEISTLCLDYYVRKKLINENDL